MTADDILFAISAPFLVLAWTAIVFAIGVQVGRRVRRSAHAADAP